MADNVQTRQVIDTVLIIRNDKTTTWQNSNYKLEKGELGIGYYDDGKVIVKVGAEDSSKTWKECKQVEDILEKDLILTYNFGRHTTSNGWVNAGGTGMTVQEWLEDALSVTEDPNVTYPNATMTAAFSPSSGEAGTYITKITWDGTYTDGRYEFGSTGNAAANSAANTTATWVVKDANGNQIGTVIDNSTGWDYSSQMTDNAVTYTLQASAICVPAADKTYIPYNNIGAEVPDCKIKGFDAAGTATKTLAPKASVTGYRKPFWAVLTEPLDLANITSGQVRGLASSATKTKGLPTTLNVPIGSRQVVLLAKAGAYSKLVAKDGNAMNAEVSFDKKAKAVKVEGANGYTAVDYDMWSVTWDGPIASAKALTLTWS